LDYDVCGPLQGIDFMVGVRRQEQYLDIRLIFGGLHDLGKDAGPFRIIDGFPASQNQLTGGMAPHHAKGLDYSHGILKGIKAGNLQNDGLIPFDAQAV
jgi:hypothetical protein